MQTLRRKTKETWANTSILHHSFKTASPIRFSSWSSSLAATMLTPTASIKGTRRISIPYTTTIIWIKLQSTMVPKVSRSLWFRMQWLPARTQWTKNSGYSHEIRLCSVQIWRINMVKNLWIGQKIWHNTTNSEIFRPRALLIVRNQLWRYQRQTMVEVEPSTHNKLSHHGRKSAKPKPKAKSTTQTATNKQNNPWQ